VSVDDKKGLIEPEHPQIRVVRQCELIGLPRATYYYKSVGECALNIELMHLIDEIYTGHPYYGSRRLRACLHRQGYVVNRKRVRRLMRQMGIVAIYPKPRVTQALKEHEKFPYLLRDLVIDHPNQVWCTDITYIRMVRGFVYLMAIMDWYSRYVISWEVSTTMETTFCCEALKKALQQATPAIFNSDQGSQFTSREFTGCLKNARIAISMDGRGRVYDNIFIERLWRSVKYEHIYLHEYATVPAVKQGLQEYFQEYNTDRPHQGLKDHTPAEVYFGSGDRVLL
jgi:putative transposase